MLSAFTAMVVFDPATRSVKVQLQRLRPYMTFSWTGANPTAVERIA